MFFDFVLDKTEDEVLDMDRRVVSSRIVMKCPQTTMPNSFRNFLPLKQYRKKLIEELITMPSFAMEKASETIRRFPVFNMKKHCVMHCKAIRIRKVKVTRRRRRVSWASDLLAFSFPAELRFASISLLIETTLLMINMFMQNIDTQGAKTRNMQCTQNS